tara:strand:+ start:818 stop:1096 length:279 start_codon:yes stop_codon:yes gene_type:complete
MKNLDALKLLFKSIFNSQDNRERKLKRVFQWKRYLKWNDLTTEEKISAKRFLLLPVFAYLIIFIFNQNFTFIVLLLMGYALYKKYEKGSIEK